MIKTIFSVAIIAISLIIGIGFRYVTNVSDDHPIEEIAEHIIEKETGYDIDLTPFSKEEKDDEKIKKSTEEKE